MPIFSYFHKATHLTWVSDNVKMFRCLSIALILMTCQKVIFARLPARLPPNLDAVLVYVVVYVLVCGVAAWTSSDRAGSRGLTWNDGQRDTCHVKFVTAVVLMMEPFITGLVYQTTNEHTAIVALSPRLPPPSPPVSDATYSNNLRSLAVSQPNNVLSLSVRHTRNSAIRWGNRNKQNIAKFFPLVVF